MGGTYSERLGWLKKLSEDKDTVEEQDKKDMKKILKTLDKIANCNLCHKKINWDEKGEGVYNLEPTETARHKSCHKEYERTRKD